MTDVALAQRRADIAPLVAVRLLSVGATVVSALAFATDLLPRSWPMVILMAVAAVVMLVERFAVGRARSVRTLDRALTLFALVNCLLNIVLLHIAADTVWIAVVGLAVNLVATGTALPLRGTMFVTAATSIGTTGYGALALLGFVEPLSVLGVRAGAELSPAPGDPYGLFIGVMTVGMIGVWLPVLAMLSHAMTSRLRHTRDALLLANGAIEAARDQANRSREELAEWNAGLNDRIRASTRELVTRNRNLAAINAISFALADGLDDHDALVRACRLVARVLDLSTVCVRTPASGSLPAVDIHVAAEGDDAGSPTDVMLEMLAAVSSGARPSYATRLLGPELEVDGEPASDPACWLAIVPLSSKGVTMGAFAAVGVRLDGWTEDDWWLLHFVGRELGLSLHNRRLYRAAVDVSARESALNEALRLLTDGADGSSVLRRAFEPVAEHLDAYFAALVIRDPGERSRRIALTRARGDLREETPFTRRALALASAAEDRSTPLLLGAHGEAPVSAALATLGVGAVLVAPVVTTRVSLVDVMVGRAHPAPTVSGALVLFAPEHAAWREQECEVVARLAAGFARRLDAEQLVRVQARRIGELAGLARVATTLQASTDADQMYEDFAGAMTALVDYEHMLVAGTGGPVPRLVRFGAGGRPLPALGEGEEGICVASLAERIPAAPVSLAVHRGVGENWAGDARHGIVAPLRARGRDLGVVALTLGAEPDAERLSVVGQAVEQLALALDGALLHRQATERAARVQVLGHLARIIASVVDLREAFGVFADEVRWLVPFDRAAMYLVDEDADSWSPYAAYPEDDAPAPVGVLAGSLVERTLADAAPVAFRRGSDAALDWSAFGPDAHEVLAVSVRSGGRARGVFALVRAKPRPFVPEEAATLTEVAGLLGVTMERLRLYEEAEYHARHDTLTGLPNVRMLNETLAAIEPEVATGRSLAVLVADMDGLKSFNDTFGHQTGDRVIQVVAQEFVRTCRASDLVARAGGDEFIIVMHDAGIEVAQQVADRIHAALRAAPSVVEGTEAPLAVSIGIATSEAHGRDVRTLLSAADEAMYEAKASGGACTRIATMSPASSEPLERTITGAVDALVSAALEDATHGERVSLELAQTLAQRVIAQPAASPRMSGAMHTLVGAYAALRLSGARGRVELSAVEALAQAAREEWEEHAPAQAELGPSVAVASVELAWEIAPAPHGREAEFAEAVLVVGARNGGRLRDAVRLLVAQVEADPSLLAGARARAA